MKISDKERRILSLIQLHANATISDMAKELNLKSYTVRYAINSLLEKKIIARMAAINYRSLGFNFYFWHCSFEGSESEKKRLLRTLIKDSRIANILEVGGAFQYHIAVLVRNLREFSEFITWLQEEHSIEFSYSSFSEELSCRFYGRRYLSGEATSKGTVIWSKNPQLVELVKADHEILRTLNDNPSMTSGQLARECGMPSSTLRYRLERLKESGVVMAYVYSMWITGSETKVLSVFLCVKCKRTDYSFEQRILSFAEKHRNVVFVARLMGSYDYQIRLEAEDAPSLSNVLKAFNSSFGKNLLTTEYYQCLAFHKTGNYPIRDYDFLTG